MDTDKDKYHPESVIARTCAKGSNSELTGLLNASLEPDVLDRNIFNVGKVVIENGRIYVDGFCVEDSSCRETAAVAMQWAINQLQLELRAVMAIPGGTGKCVVD